MAEFDPAEIKVRYPPPEGSLGKLIPVMCQKCEWETEIWIAHDAPTPANGCLAKCPCKGKMLFNYAGLNISAKVRGPGVSSSKYGMRRARELTKRSEELSKTQWSNHEPLKPLDGATVRNPTENGPYDPNGPFAKRKTNKKIFLG